MLISVLAAMVPALLWHFPDSIRRRNKLRPVSRREAVWKRSYLVFLGAFVAIVMTVLAGGFVKHKQSTNRFYTEVNKLERQIEEGNSSAGRELAYLYLNQKRTTQYSQQSEEDFKEGTKLLEQWLRREIRLGNGQKYSKDMFTLARAVVHYDKDKAQEWFKYANEHGHGSAKVNLGRLSGEPATDKTPPIPGREEAAERRQELAGVQAQLGQTNRVDNGLGSGETPSPGARLTADRSKDQEITAAARVEPVLRSDGVQAAATGVKKTVDWYRNAAEQGDAAAQSYMGWLYFRGEGVPQDLEEALKWYSKAARQGNAAAQTNLGWMYDSGQGISQNRQHAVEWYRKAAEQGYAPAQANLGAMYGTGDSLPQDYILAYMWNNLAAAQGHTDAQKNRDQIAAKMTAGQIAEAQQRTRKWAEERNN